MSNTSDRTHRSLKAFYATASLGLAQFGRNVCAAGKNAVRDGTLPLLMLGVLAAAFFAAVVLQLPKAIVFGILCIGLVTALVETNGRNRDHD